MAERFHGIDALRGLAVVSMVAYHLLYDINTVYGLQAEWINDPLVCFWQQCTCWAFILIAGFSWEWGKKHNLARGVKLSLYGIIISFISVLLLPNHAIWFGILSFLGAAILIQIVLNPLTSRLAPLTGVILTLILHFLLQDIQFGIIGPGWELPNIIYSTYLGVPFGLKPIYFTTVDYYPILTWYPVFLCGTYLYRLFLQCPNCKRCARTRIPALSAIGRHTLVIYLIHQPVLFVLCYLFMGLPR